MRIHTFVLIGLLACTASIQAAAAACRCEYADKSALQVGAQQMVDEFLALAREAGQADLDGVSVKVENTPALIFVSFDQEAIFVPWWPELDPQTQGIFSQLAGDADSARRMFNLLFQQFFIPHEAAHWLQYRARGATSGGEFMAAVDHYRNEREANQLAVAYWMSTAGGSAYLAELEAVLAPVLAQLPDPVPAGSTPADHFNSQYAALGGDPVAYAWFQFRFVIDALAQRRHLDFKDLVDALPRRSNPVGAGG